MYGSRVSVSIGRPGAGCAIGRNHNGKMLKATLVAPERIELGEAEIPAPGKDEVFNSGFTGWRMRF